MGASPPPATQGGATNAIRDAAQALYEAGINVLPAKRGEKSPALTSWREYQRVRVPVGKLDEWFSAEHNIWAVTGRISGVVVLDCDSEAALAFWRDVLGDELEATACSRTAKGYHFWFRLGDETIRSWGRHDAQTDVHFDLRAEGTGVIAPPSVHPSGVRYEWIRPLAAARPIPPALRGSIAPVSPDLSAGHAGGGLAALLDALPQHEGEGRNDALTRIAGHLAQTMPHEDGYVALIGAVNRSLAEPLPEAEVYKLASSIWQAEQRARTILPDEDPRFDRDVRTEAYRLRVREAAQAAHRQRAWTVPPSTFNASEFLSIEYPPARWTVHDLLPEGGNALLAATFKAGKTTLLLHLLRSLCDRRAFLGRFNTSLGDARVAYFNYELPARQFQAWLRGAMPDHPERATVLNLRGYPLVLSDKDVREWTIEWLRLRSVAVWIVDPFAVAYDGDENDNSQVRAFTVALDEIKERAGVNALILSAHFGRMQHEPGTEHARGATRLDDWADVRWVITRQADERFFTAEGRDVMIKESRLVYYDQGRSYVLMEGSRAERRSTSVTDQIVRYLVNAVKEGAPEAALTSRAIRQNVGGRSQDKDEALRRLEQRGIIGVVVRGSSRMHYPREWLPPGASVRQPPPPEEDDQDDSLWA